MMSNLLSLTGILEIQFEAIRKDEGLRSDQEVLSMLVAEYRTKYNKTQENTEIRRKPGQRKKRNVSL